MRRLRHAQARDRLPEPVAGGGLGHHLRKADDERSVQQQRGQRRAQRDQPRRAEVPHEAGRRQRERDEQERPEQVIDRPRRRRGHVHDRGGDQIEAVVVAGANVRRVGRDRWEEPVRDGPGERQVPDLVHPEGLGTVAEDEQIEGNRPGQHGRGTHPRRPAQRPEIARAPCERNREGGREDKAQPAAERPADGPRHEIGDEQQPQEADGGRVERPDQTWAAAEQHPRDRQAGGGDPADQEQNADDRGPDRVRRVQGQRGARLRYGSHEARREIS